MVARLLVLGGALAGLIAMHGLSDHGASSHEMEAPMNPAVTVVSHVGHAADNSRGQAADAATGAVAPGEHAPGMAMAGLCLAVLAGAVIGLALLRPHRAVVFIRPTALAVSPARPSARRDRDPPCLFQLSVLRT
jgi:hypothetical protein